jgi:hypothetical protein
VTFTPEQLAKNELALEALSKEPIHSYHYRPRPIAFNDLDRYIAQGGRCQVTVQGERMQHWQCSKKAITKGFVSIFNDHIGAVCHVHSPEAKAKRRKAQDDSYKALTSSLKAQERDRILGYFGEELLTLLPIVQSSMYNGEIIRNNTREALAKIQDILLRMKSRVEEVK